MLYYNKTKGGVDNLVHFVTLCTCKRKILRWPMAIFFNMIDVAVLAALIVWTIKFPEKKTPLAIQKGAKHGLIAMGYEINEPRPATESATNCRYMCPRTRDRKLQMVCEVSKNVYKEHRSNIFVFVFEYVSLQRI